MRLTDLPEVLAIERFSFAAPWSQLAFEAEMEKTYASLRVARQQGRGKGRSVVGYVCVWLVADEIQIANLAVHIGYRRRGVGVALLLHAFAEGYSAGARLAVLEVARKNTAARALYERMGFAVVQERPRYYPESRDDALIMELSLSRSDMIGKRLR
jgi:ribosomal-protein-alanine N-acetyltransferase